MDYFFQEQRWTDTFLSLHVKKFKRIILFLLIAFSAAGTKAQSDVKFNDYVRYSQWVIDSRLGDFYGNTNDFGFTTYNRDLSVKKNVTKWKKGSEDPKVDYVAGLVAKATIEAAEYYQNFDWAKPWFKSVEWYGNKCTVSPTPDNLDAINASKMYFGIYKLANSTDGAFKSNAADGTASKATNQLGNALTALRNYNKEYKSDGTGGYAFPANTTVTLGGNSISLDGGWFHKKSYLHEMWLDGQYMGPAMLAQLIKGYSSYTQISSNDWELITKQFTIVWNMCWDDTQKLLYHAFCSEPRSKTWAAKAEIWTEAQRNTSSWRGMSAAGHSAAFWGRAEGWYFLALVDVLEQMQIAGLNSETNPDHDCYMTLKEYLDKLALGIAKRQDATSGCWYQLIGKDGNYSAQYYNGYDKGVTKNYLESSCTAIFAAAFLKATRLKLLSSGTDGTTTYNYEEIGTNAYKGAVAQFMKQRTDGTVDLLGCCKSAGVGTAVLGETKFRDGSNAYYLHGYDVTPTSTNSGDYYTEGKVMGAFIMAATEYERANEKDIRFSYDLAPTYDLAQGGSITAEALGSGTISYQWFNASDNSLVYDGQTFAPTKSGSYYCQATSGSTTIQTSKTTVTVSGTSNENVGSGTNKDIFSLTVTYNKAYSLASGAYLNLTSDYATVTGGSALVHNGKSGDPVVIIYLKNNKGNIALNGSGGTYAKLTLDTPLQKGDVITFTSDENSIGSFYLTTTSTKNTNCSVTGGTYTVTSSDGLANSTELYVWSNSKGKFKSITITRNGSSTETSGYTVTATAENGTVTITDESGNKIASGSQVNSGTKLVFTATANSGYKFSSWSVNGTTGTESGATYTIASLTKATSVTANFTETSSGGGNNDQKIYKYQVAKAGLPAPAINSSKYITTTEDETGNTGTKLVKMTFGGWRWKGGKYIKPGGTNEITDSWTDSETEEAAVTDLDGFKFWFRGTQDAAHEKKDSVMTMYGKPRYGWFVSPKRENGITTDSHPYTLPVRGSFMTFEPTMNGTLTIYILQNGVWNSDTKNHIDIIPGEFRMHAFQITNQRGLVLAEFAPKYSVTNNQKVNPDYKCTNYETQPTSFNNQSKDVSEWEEFWDLSPTERKAVHDSWSDPENGDCQKIIKLDNGSFLAIQKAVVKYQFHVTGNETYYFFSNFSKMGFSGATFQPDAAQPTDETTFSGVNSLSDTKDYTEMTMTPNGTIGETGLTNYKYTINGEEVGKVDGVFIPQFKAITLQRTFKPNQWTTLSLPFNLTQTEVEQIFGKGTQIIVFDKANYTPAKLYLTFFYHEIQNVLPGYPYLIRPTLKYAGGNSNSADYAPRYNIDGNGNLTEFTVYNKAINPHILPYEFKSGDYTAKCTPSYCTADVKGNYSKQYKKGDIFVSEGNGTVYISEGSSYGKGYRSYIEFTGTGTPPSAKALSISFSGVEDDDDNGTTTEIRVTELADDVIQTLGIGGVYNLNGQKVADTTRNLPAGIYIVNGRKVVVK